MRAELFVIVFLTACAGADGAGGLNGTDGANGRDGEAGADGKPSLLRLDEEPPGSNCPHGGTAIHSGLDDDGDGVLDDAETDATAFLCSAEDGEDGEDGTDGVSGTDGEAGADGKTSLLRLAEEPAGGNCPYGGTAIHSGIDDDGDGLLDADETDATAYLCSGDDDLPSGVFEGTVSILTSRDVAWLANVSAITGDLIVEAPGLMTLSMPKLERVGGRLIINAADLTTLDLPALSSVGHLDLKVPMLPSLAGLSALSSVAGGFILRSPSILTSLEGLEELASVGGDLYIDGDLLVSLVGLEGLVTVGGSASFRGESLTTLTGLENLAFVGKDFRLEDNPGLTTLASLASLATIEGWLIINGAGELTVFDGLGTLEHAGGIGVWYSSKMTAISFPNLKTTGEFTVYGMQSLETISVPVLSSVARDFRFENNLDLASVSAPMLTQTYRLWLKQNAKLTTLHLPSLVTVDDSSEYAAQITGNTSLSTCQAEAIRDALVDFTGVFSIENNGPCL